MPTVLDFYSDALAEAGLQQPQQTPSGSTLAFVRRKFADLVQQWSEIRLRLFFVPETIYPLVAAKGSYAIGPGAADFDTTGGVYTQPVFIQSARCVVGVNRRVPMSIITRPDWDIDEMKSLTDPDGPLKLFYDYNIPVATINVSAIPGNNTNIYVSQWNPLRAFADGEEGLNVEDFYPKSYLSPLRCGLAIALASSYKRQVSQETLGVFQSGIAIIENKNREKLIGAYALSQTIDGPTKGDGIMTPGQPPPQQQAQ